MRLLALLALLAPAPAAAGACDDPAPWPGGPDAAVAFEAVAALEPGRAGDGPNPPDPVELFGDVLGVGQAVATATGLQVAEVVCIRGRPEWLGLTVRNPGAADAGGQLALTLPDGRALEAPLPPVPAGGERRFLVRASDPIAAAAIVLRASPSTSR
jgi:hypothetical protein